MDTLQNQYAPQSQQQSLLILFLSAAHELVPFNTVLTASVDQTGFQVLFSVPLQGEKLLLTVIEEEMRRKQRSLQVESFSMMAQIVQGFLKSRGCALVGDLPDEGVVEIALFGKTAVVLKVDSEIDLRNTGPFSLYSKENMVEGFAAVDKSALKELKSSWSQVFAQPAFQLMNGWIADPQFTGGALISSFLLKAATDSLIQICIDDAKARGLTALFDLPLTDFNFLEAAKKGLPLFITTMVDVQSDPLLWQQEYAKAPLFLSFTTELHLQKEMQHVLRLLENAQKNLGLSCSMQIAFGGKAIKAIFEKISALFPNAQLVKHDEMQSDVLFKSGEICLEMHMQDYRGRSQLLSVLRIGKHPTLTDGLYIAFVPFYGLEKIISVLIDRLRGRLPPSFPLYQVKPAIDS